MQRVLAICGGVGGAKLALGLARVLPVDALTIAVNTGDDEEFYGLHVSPDIDTVVYTLAGAVNPETGWGLRDDSFGFLDAMAALGGDCWFRLGDRDLAMHVRRTQLLRAGASLTDATRELAAHLGVGPRVVPMTDGRVRTVVETDRGTMSFQEYFVRYRCEPVVRSLRYEGAASARPSPLLREALESADAIVFCPSNPFLSVAPVLAVGGVREALAARPVPRVVVTPIISGEAVKGPTAKLFEQLLGEPASCVAVARYYRGLASHFVLDERDAVRAPEIEALGYAVLTAQTLMTSEADKVALAESACRLLAVEV